MYDTGKIIVGLGIFVILFTSPIWYNLTVGQEVVLPDAKPAIASLRHGAPIQCIEDTQYMREKHMDLLDTWRLEVVRGENLPEDRFYKRDGKYVYWKDLIKDPEKAEIYGDAKVQKSLSNTCMHCHSNYVEFCNRCHTSNSVDPFCWDCHIRAPQDHGTK